MLLKQTHAVIVSIIKHNNYVIISDGKIILFFYLYLISEHFLVFSEDYLPFQVIVYSVESLFLEYKRTEFFSLKCEGVSVKCFDFKDGQFQV